LQANIEFNPKKTTHLTELLDNFNENESNIDGLSNDMDRVRHFYVDIIIINAITLLVYFGIVKKYYVPDGRVLDSVFLIEFSVIYILYYLIFEGGFSRTPGKFLNKTKVFNAKGQKPTFTQILLRTILRLLPISILTMFTPYGRTLHDIVSKTWVLRIK
jgi:uncharacterized RDD family membrane protein YckC